jgi:hypothetical protein
MSTVRSAIALAALALALTSCGDRDDATEEPDTAAATDSLAENLQNTTLGPLTYQFDQGALTAADVVIAIPPGYQSTSPATKLIPEARADLLGQNGCTYGESGETSACNAEQEIGLAVALLPRPIDEYRAAFDDERLERAELDGIDGFSFTTQAEGAGTEYRFFGLEGRTIMLARKFDGSIDSEAAEAIAQVISTLSESVDRRIEATG